MRTTQLIRFAVGGLWRQKVRTALTLVGVTVGTCALVFSLSLGMGLRAFVEHEFKSRDDFWRINVRTTEPAPDESTIPADLIDVKGTFSPERKARLRESLVQKNLQHGTPKPGAVLTPAKVAEIKALPDVAEVRTFRSSEGRVWVGDRSTAGLVVAGNLSGMTDRLTAGRLPGEQADEALVSEFVLYELGLRSDAEFDAAIGRRVAVEVGGVHNTKSMTLARVLTGRFGSGEVTRDQAAALDKLTAGLPKAIDAFDLTPAERAGLKALVEKKGPAESPWVSGQTVRGDFALAGVFRATSREDEKQANPLGAWELRRGEVLLPTDPGERLFSRLEWMKETGFPMAEVRVRPGGDMAAVVAALEKMGYSVYSPLRWFNNAKREVTMIAGGLNLFALIALFVAGIGITNTLVTSVVERTREIGILKSVGATRGQVQGIFLTEGTVIGFAGALLGMVFARLLAFPADKWVHTLIQKQTNGEALVTETIFTFPWWLWAGGLLFAVVVTTAAAYYPARRAARVHPIEALRYG